MEPQKIKEFNVSRMTIEKNVLSWEDHAVRLPGVVRIWVGDSPRRTFPISMVLILLMIALSGPGIVNKAVMLAVLGVYIGTHLRSGKNTDPQAGGKDHVNLELCSGMVYSFASGSESFAMELYEVLKHLMEGDASMSHCDIVFENGGEIIDQTKQEEPEKTSSVLELNVSGGQSGQIVQELKKLYGSYTKKTNTNSEVLSLINEAASLIEKNDRVGLKSVFEKFISLGLINDCNELGLDSLLQEIRATIY